jgi:hypothetical protein
MKPMLERASGKPVIVEVAPKRVKRAGSRRRPEANVAVDEPDLIGAK